MLSKLAFWAYKFIVFFRCCFCRAGLPTPSPVNLDLFSTLWLHALNVSDLHHSVSFASFMFQHHPVFPASFLPTSLCSDLSRSSFWNLSIISQFSVQMMMPGFLQLNVEIVRDCYDSNCRVFKLFILVKSGSVYWLVPGPVVHIPNLISIRFM